jgi:hypothetical protein
MSLDDLILTAFCWVDDELHAAHLDALRQRGLAPLLADSEVITSELVGEYLGFDADARLFWYFRPHHADAFPGLALLHRTSFARQAANLWQAKQLLH